jgi:integrase
MKSPASVDVGRKPDGKRDQRTFTYDTLREARAERARIISEHAKGTYVRPAKTTVEAWLAEWLDMKQRAGKATTYRCYADSLRAVRERYGHLQLQDLTERNLEALITDMRSGKARRRGVKGKPLSARAVNVMLTVLSMALTVAVKRQKLVRNIVETVGRDKRPAARRRPWEVADAIQFLRFVRDDRLYAGWLLSLLGLRRGEVCGLRWSDVDFTPQIGGRYGDAPYGTLTVAENRLDVAGEEVIDTPKSEESERTLPLPKFVSDALAALKKRQEAARARWPEVWAVTNPQDRVVTRVDGTPVVVGWYSEEFSRNVGRAGVPAATLHAARHTAATLMAHLGIPMVVAAAWLGQSQLSITQHYQQATWGGMLDASKRLEALLTQAPAPGQVASVIPISGVA